MNFLKKKKTFFLNESEANFSVRYLGNVLTSMTKGEGCLDRPVNILWNNFLKTNKRGAPLRLILSPYSLKAEVASSPFRSTEYYANRLTLVALARDVDPRLFVWVYRHEGAKGRSELRCHAAFCRRRRHAEELERRLKETLENALKEYSKEQRRRERRRVEAEARLSTHPDQTRLPLRHRLLASGLRYRPPIASQRNAPSLESIEEVFEDYLEADGKFLGWDHPSEQILEKLTSPKNCWRDDTLEKAEEAEEEEHWLPYFVSKVEVPRTLRPFPLFAEDELWRASATVEASSFSTNPTTNGDENQREFVFSRDDLSTTTKTATTTPSIYSSLINRFSNPEDSNASIKSSFSPPNADFLERTFQYDDSDDIPSPEPSPSQLAHQSPLSHSNASPDLSTPSFTLPRPQLLSTSPSHRPLPLSFSNAPSTRRASVISSDLMSFIRADENLKSFVEVDEEGSFGHIRSPSLSSSSSPCPSLTLTPSPSSSLSPSHSVSPSPMPWMTVQCDDVLRSGMKRIPVDDPLQRLEDDEEKEEKARSHCQEISKVSKIHLLTDKDKDVGFEDKLVGLLERGRSVSLSDNSSRHDDESSSTGIESLNSSNVEMELDLVPSMEADDDKMREGDEKIKEGVEKMSGDGETNQEDKKNITFHKGNSSKKFRKTEDEMDLKELEESLHEIKDSHCKEKLPPTDQFAAKTDFDQPTKILNSKAHLPIERSQTRKMSEVHLLIDQSEKRTHYEDDSDSGVDLHRNPDRNRVVPWTKHQRHFFERHLKWVTPSTVV